MRITINKLSYIFNWLFMFIILIVSDETLMFGTNGNNFFISVKYAIIVGLSVLLSLKYIILRMTFKYREFLFLLCMIFLVIISSLWNSDMRFGILYKLLLFLLAYSITQKMTLLSFAYYFDRIMYMLAIVSLIGFLLSIIAKPLLSVFPILTNSSGTTFYNLLFTMVPTSSELVRNFGLYREPGVYQMFLIIALMLEFSVLNNVDTKKNLVYIVTIISTLSTTGYFALAVVFCLYFIKRKGADRKTYNTVIILSLIAVFSIFLFEPMIIADLFESVFGKLGNTSRYTTIARFGSITENVRIFKENVMFGAGLTKLDTLFPLYCANKYGWWNTNNTNTILIQFAAHGLMYGLFYSFGIFSLCKKISNNIMECILITIAFTVVFIGENLTFSVFPYILIFYGMKHIDDSKKHTRMENY